MGGRCSGCLGSGVALGGIGGTFVDGSTCCVVVVRYRARRGRRKVGGNAVFEVRVWKIARGSLVFIIV